MTTTMENLLGWWNLIFLAPFAVAMLYLLVYTLTGLTFGDADFDPGADADADADVDADADADGDHDAGHHAGGGSTSFSALALSWLGVGRVPVSLILLMLMLVWGSVGFVTNAALRERGAVGWEAARWSIPVAFVAAVLITRTVVMLLGRFVPLYDNAALPLRGLVGAEGEALHRIDSAFGMVIVRDAHGELIHVPCRVGDGVAPVEKGARVKLVAYAADARTFYVAAVDGAAGEVKPADAL